MSDSTSSGIGHADLQGAVRTSCLMDIVTGADRGFLSPSRLIDIGTGADCGFLPRRWTHVCGFGPFAPDRWRSSRK